MKEYPDTNAETRARELLLMRAGGLAFAVHAEECECVTPWAEPAPLPHAPAAVLGVVSVRGRIRTVLDPARMLGAAAPGYDRAAAGHRLLASLAGDEQLALALEASELVTLSAGEQTQPETVSLPVRATFHHGGETVYLLDPSRLFDAAMSGAERRRQRTVSREP